MEIRLTSYEDYGLSTSEAREILNICRAPKFPRCIALSAALETNPDLALCLVRSICDRVSWAKMPAASISENSFYGYRRKCISLLKQELQRLGKI